jgi:hypothetical protein
MNTCWAYNSGLQRCTLNAGHDGDHGIFITWGDNDCFTPATVKLDYDLAPPPVEETAVESCAACNHMHKGNTCKCGCYSHI